MITGLYSAIADSFPILCITGQAPRARLYKQDFPVYGPGSRGRKRSASDCRFEASTKVSIILS